MTVLAMHDICTRTFRACIGGCFCKNICMLCIIEFAMCADQLNSDAEVWQKEPVYGYAGFSGLVASARCDLPREISQGSHNLQIVVVNVSQSGSKQIEIVKGKQAQGRFGCFYEHYGQHQDPPCR